MAARVTKKLLQDLNTSANASDPYETEDKENWLPEASLTGKDCDSYASYKKRYLLRLDWELNNFMCIATCDTSGDGRADHAVLLVWDEETETCYVLDNRNPWVESIGFYRRGYGYNFVSIPQYMQDLMSSAK